MALKTINRLTPPPISKKFAAGEAHILHLDTAHGGSAPLGVNHLPCLVIPDTEAVQGFFTWKDIYGATCSINYPGNQVSVPLPIAPAELTIANEQAVTVFWQPGSGLI
jgi:hypothetical protein